MTSNKLFGMATTAMVLAIGGQARGSVQLDLNFTDSGNEITGQFTADPLIGGGFLATGGTLDVSSSTTPGLAGLYTLVPASGPGISTSPDGSFYYNDILYYPGQPYVDYYGLLAVRSTPTSKIYINLWFQNNDYQLWAAQGTQNYILADDVPSNGSATTSIAVVPECSTIIASVLLLILPLGTSTMRILRREGR